VIAFLTAAAAAAAAAAEQISSQHLGKRGRVQKKDLDSNHDTTSQLVWQ
jgi:hypothetical protein